MALLSICAAGVFLTDQSSKLAIRRLMPVGATVQVGPFLTLRYAMTQTGLLHLSTDRIWLTALWVMAVVGVLLVAGWVPLFHNTWAQVGLGAALGGATGNFLERVSRGAVTDFIGIGVWMAFNLADVAIVLGVGTALLGC